MSEVGLFLASEEHGPRALVEQARMGEEAGFRSVMISDHFHPWIDRQGESPFVWSVIGGIAASTNLAVMTGVTCPTVRIHPVVLAQATATCELMLEGRFTFGVGSGEALNEHITGERWPPAPVRLEMLEEAVELIRRLWQGESVTHYGRHYTVENARIYSKPTSPPPVAMSSFGPRSMEVAARIADGLVTSEADRSVVDEYRSSGGKGPTTGFLKVCYDSDEKRALKLAHSLWPTESLPGQLNQDLPTPTHFEQAASLVTEEMTAEMFPCGPDPERHAAKIREFLEAGFDQVFVNQIGSEQGAFLDFFAREIRHRIGA